ncbi:hypothetical protein CPC08DRAFT_766781 [Agrocybe pediades]|nr:hypothetical protein CPC08DRAFT_766781 [Agrocybe pediades]
MSSTNDFALSLSVTQQKALISSDLNSILLLHFLFGIYTGVFPAAIYIYGVSSISQKLSCPIKEFTIYKVHKKNRTQASDRIVMGSITASYFTTALTIVMNWLYTNILLGKHGATRAEIVLETLTQDVPLGESIIEDLTLFVVYLLADGLLVWRCFHSCGRSFRRSLPRIALLIVETVLALTTIAYSLLIDAKPGFKTTQADVIFNRLSAAAFVAAATTSFVSTGVICRQIWRHTTPISRSRKRYRTIINALIESSAIYPVAVLFEAALQFAYTGSVESSLEVLIITNFVSAVTQIISGLAPALMIARLFLSSGQEDTEVFSAHIPSDLITHASHATGANMTNVGADLEMQQRVFIEVGEEEREEIQVVSRNAYQLGDDGENRLGK